MEGIHLKLKTLFVVFFISAFLACLSSPASAGFSLGYAQDVIHAPGTKAAIARYDHDATRLGGQAMYWDGPDNDNMAFGLDYDLIPSDTIDLNLGGVYLTNVNGINGTNLNFSIGLGINLGKYVKVQFSHFSNARARNNNGWNFVGLLYRF